MKTLYLLRHLKSSWDDPALADHDRPLAKRGRGAARRLAAYLRTAEARPDLVVCSTATRARETFIRVAEGLGSGPLVEYRRDLYLAEADDMVGLLKRLDDNVGSVMLIGHNPGLEQLAALLAAAGDSAARQRMATKYPTGGLAVIELAIRRWRELKPGCGRLEEFVTPALLAEA